MIPLGIWKNSLLTAKVISKLIEIQPNVFRCEIDRPIDAEDDYEIYPTSGESKKMRILISRYIMESGRHILEFAETKY